MVKNHTIFTGDNLPIMRGMESESVDLIYLDPPFNSNRSYSAPIGSKAAGAAFKDTWTLSDTDDAWWGEIADEQPSLYKVIDAAGEVGGKGDKAYLIYMAMRLLEMKRILKPTGSIYLHCDPTMSHSLKLTMDAIFGGKNFRNEIVWHYDGPQRPSKSDFSTKHDIIIRHGKSEKIFANLQGLNRKFELSETELKNYKKDDNGRWYYDLPRGDYTDESIKRLDREGRIRWTKNGNARVKYFLEIKGGKIFREKRTHDVWTDILSLGHVNKKERVKYPTQKPLDLLKRIVKASSNEGDMVFDPFCGCATTLIAAQDLKRQWIGIDISSKAVDLVKTRLEKDLGLFADFIHRTDIPTRKQDIKRSKNIKHILYGKQEGKCGGCKIWFGYRNMTIDHIISKNKGGADDDPNLQLLCGSCNSTKGDREMEFLIAKLKEQKII